MHVILLSLRVSSSPSLSSLQCFQLLDKFLSRGYNEVDTALM